MTSRSVPMPTERVLADFLGRWEIAREIVPASGPRASFSGHAEWSAAPGGAEYFETGVLHLDGAPPMTAERRYHWAEDLSVRFGDGRDFHQVPPAGGQASHFCDPDTYLVTYDFSDWPAFTVRYDVSGPRKDYVMISRFRRAGAG
ncbi:DUF6314 family protein [uncultured Tateyamaria sp.]|uniref:DUF6314 family protein n=1 Tax=uncultured Tateyamaria sp. TaxID=455651 RepID=UPI002628853B|nr:DUF6314 family protein [uncultured Tateyamaria sp.]